MKTVWFLLSFWTTDNVNFIEHHNLVPVTSKTYETEGACWADIPKSVVLKEGYVLTCLKATVIDKK